MTFFSMLSKADSRSGVYCGGGPSSTPSSLRMVSDVNSMRRSGWNSIMLPAVCPGVWTTVRPPIRSMTSPSVRRRSTLTHS